MTSSLILGSGSPRRREILGYFNVPFECDSPPFDEASVPTNMDAHTYAATITQGKLESLKKKHSNSVLLCADTVVDIDGTLLGKPSNEAEAFTMLKVLAGSWHRVVTAVAVWDGTQSYETTEESRILFNNATDSQLHRYHEQLYCLDKAGGYAVQEAGSIIINRIEGCYYNVMGLPINATRELLMKAGIDLWDHLAS